jgi:Protein of unknown function, DUF547
MPKLFVPTRLGRRSILIGLFAMTLPSSGRAQPASDPDSVFDALLQRYVSAAPDGVNRVDYAKWHRAAADRKALDTYIEQMSARKPSQLPRGEAMSYWGNLYNAVTLKVVLDAFPVDSIRDIKSDSWLDPKAYLGPWRQQRISVEGRRLSLDDIEHSILRPTFKDARVHYMVNCASIGCPNLMARAWRPASLDVDLDNAARSFINHPRAVSVLPSGTLKVSSIYKWFVEDFGGNDAGVITHLRKFAGPELAKALNKVSSISEDGYDWTLNATSRPGHRS